MTKQSIYFLTQLERMPNTVGGFEILLLVYQDRRDGLLRSARNDGGR
jgi:hypothetical protein